MALNSGTPLNYTGVRSPTPPNFATYNRAPTVNDTQNFNIGALWLDKTTQFVYMLVSLSGTIAAPHISTAIWIQFIGGGGSSADEFVTDAGIAFPLAGVIDILGGANINTAGGGNTVTVNLDTSIQLPPTSADQSSGVISIGGDPFIQAYGTNNTFIGADAGNFTLNTGSALRNSALGTQALNALTTGADNLALGAAALNHLTTGSRNVAAGNGALGDLIVGSDSVAIGNTAASNSTGSEIIAIGSAAGDNYTTESNNIVLGNAGTAADSHVMRLGTDGTGAGQISSTFIAGTVETARGLTVRTGDATIIAGNLNLPATNTAGTEGVITLGGSPFIMGPDMGSNTFVGLNAGTSNTTGATDCVGIGQNTLQAIAGLANGLVAIGESALTNTIDGRACVAIGHETMLTALAVDRCVAVGYNALKTSETGVSNTAIGNGSLNALTLGYSDNTAVGDVSMSMLTAGERNTAIGSGAGDAYTTTESDNIAIGHTSGVVGDSNTLRIGLSTGAGAGELNRSFIHGIRGITTGVNDAVTVLIDSAGQLGTVSSSARYKENIQDMGAESSAILNLRPVVFNYKEDSSKQIEFGLIAEEVADTFKRLVIYGKDKQPETVSYHNLIPMLLNELQKQHKTIVDLTSRIEALESH